MIGIPSNSGNPLTREQQQQNAREIWGYFQAQGWTLKAVSGMLGNMEVESYINPAQWENGKPFYQGGFGLVQWTPYTKFSNWAGSSWETNYAQQPRRIQYEVEVDRTAPNTLQWIALGRYNNMSFYEFSQSTWTPAQLAHVFFDCYERGTVYGNRDANANFWYEYLGGAGPIVGGNIPIWLLFKLKERYKQ